MEYYTDGTNLYEVIAEDLFRNGAIPSDYTAGCEQGDVPTFIREVALRDCRTGEVTLVLGPVLAKLRKVCELDEQADSKSATT